MAVYSYQGYQGGSPGLPSGPEAGAQRDTFLTRPISGDHPPRGVGTAMTTPWSRTICSDRLGCMDGPELLSLNADDGARRGPSALRAAVAEHPGPIGRVVLDTGLEGRGLIRSADRVAADALRGAENQEAAIERLVRDHIAAASVGGFVTVAGGYRTPLPLALSVSLAEFYVLATRMVGAIAVVRGYDVRQPEVRTAVLLTLVAARSDEALTEEGIGAGKLPRMALRRLPPGALMLVNKAICLSMLRRVNERLSSRLGHGVPLLGGGIGAALDSWMMTRIAGQARVEFPARDTGQSRSNG